MVNRLLQPQEIEVFYVIPAVRRELALCMKSSGKSQREISGLLGVTEAAVSQYMTFKRAKDLDFSPSLKAAIEAASKRITGELSLTREMQQLLGLIREERVVCRIHEKLGTAPKGCNVCFENPLVDIKGA